MKSKFLMMLFASCVFASSASANPYKWIKVDSDGTIHGECSGSSVAFSGSRSANGYTFSTPGNSKFSASRNTAIQHVCSRAKTASSSKSIAIPARSLVCFDKGWVAERSQSLATIEMTYRIISTGGITSADCLVTKSSGRYTLISRNSRANAPYVYARDSEGVKFYAFTNQFKN